MTTRIGRSSHADKHRSQISTTELLQAVADLGPNWPAHFGDHEIVAVTQALDRELIAGTLINATTIRPCGWQLLRPTPGWERSDETDRVPQYNRTPTRAGTEWS